jgi:hypothetical protein
MTALEPLYLQRIVGKKKRASLLVSFSSWLVTSRSSDRPVHRCKSPGDEIGVPAPAGFISTMLVSLVVIRQEMREECTKTDFV